MDIGELWKTPHLSASSIGKYIDCSLMYRFSKIDKLKPEITSDALIFGSAIHFVVSLINQGRKVGSLLGLSDIYQSFEEQWTAAVNRTENLRYSKGNTFDSLLAQGKNMLKAYVESGLDEGFKVISIEEPFRFTIPGLAVPIIGITDLIEEDNSGTVIITDYKTRNKAYSENDIDTDMQLTLYQMAIKASEYRDREIMLRFIALIKTKTPKVEHYWTTRTELDEKRLEKKAIQVWDGIQKSVFIPNDGHWKCTNCGYKTACEAWSQPDLEAANG